MINDLIELESLLGQYDPGRILVGPLLSLSLNSNFRYFYIAGQASKVYESIGLGFVERETEAQGKREALITANLRSRFEVVEIVDDQLKLARTVHSLWPNDETMRFLVAVALEAKLQLTPGADQENSDNADDVGERSGDAAEQVIGAPSEAPVADTDVAEPSAVDAALASGRDLAQSMLPEPTPNGVPRLPDAYRFWPLKSDAATPAHGMSSSPSRDDIASAILGLKSSMGIAADLPPPETPADLSAPDLANRVMAADLAPGKPGTDLPKPRLAGDPPIPAWAADLSTQAGKGRTPIILRVGGLAGAAALLAGLIILSSTRRMTDDLTAASKTVQRSVSADRELSAEAPGVTGSIPQSRIGGDAKAKSEAAPVAVPPAPKSAGTEAPQARTKSQAAGAQTSASPSEDRSSRVPEVSHAQLDAPPVVTTPSLPAQSPSARASADGAAANNREAPHSSASALSSPPTTAPAVSTPGSKPSQSADRQPLVASAPGPPSRAPEAAHAQSSTKALASDEIAALLGRGNDFIKTGDFAGARILLQRAAESGSAEAALMLGKTYDPLFIQEVGALGIQADTARCRQWYQKAAELGSEAAAQRLAKLTEAGQ
jgi:hypothetical protein